MPRSTEVSLTTSVRVMISVSPDLPVTVHRPGSSVSRHGGDIQFSGLYEPPSGGTSTQPSALTVSRRRASGGWAVRRPTELPPHPPMAERHSGKSTGSCSPKLGTREPPPEPP